MSSIQIYYMCPDKVKKIEMFFHNNFNARLIRLYTKYV